MTGFDWFLIGALLAVGPPYCFGYFAMLGSALFGWFKDEPNWDGW